MSYRIELFRYFSSALFATKSFVLNLHYYPLPIIVFAFMLQNTFLL